MPAEAFEVGGDGEGRVKVRLSRGDDDVPGCAGGAGHGGVFGLVKVSSVNAGASTEAGADMVMTWIVAREVAAARSSSWAVMMRAEPIGRCRADSSMHALLASAVRSRRYLSEFEWSGTSTSLPCILRCWLVRRCGYSA